MYDTQQTTDADGGTSRGGYFRWRLYDVDWHTPITKIHHKMHLAH